MPKDNTPQDQKASGLSYLSSLNPSPYLEGQGDLVSRLKRGVIRVTIWVIEVIHLLSKSP